MGNSPKDGLMSPNLVRQPKSCEHGPQSDICLTFANHMGKHFLHQRTAKPAGAARIFLLMQQNGSFSQRPRSRPTGKEDAGVKPPRLVLIAHKSHVWIAHQALIFEKILIRILMGF